MSIAKSFGAREHRKRTTMLLQELKEKNLISPPTWLPMNTMYLATMGSIAYGVAEDTSDFDVYGWAVPPRNMVFPHLAGYINGFGTPPPSFNNWQKHHVLDKDALGGKGREYDFSIFSIVKYFDLCMSGNPNMIDSLFVPQSCILHSTNVSNMVREERHLFITKLIWPRLKGYAYSQLHKASGKNPEKGSKRHKLREKHGFDSKFLYHVVRLLSQAEQIFLEGDLDLQEKGRREHMKAIRRGETSEKEIRQWASDKEAQLEKIYLDSKLPQKPDEERIKKLLQNCLEEHYGNLGKVFHMPSEDKVYLRKIKEIIQEANV